MPPPASDFRYRSARNDDEPFLWTALYYAVHVPPGHAAPPLEIVRRPELARYVKGWSAQIEPGVIAEAAGCEPIGAAWVRLLSGDHRGYGHVADDVPELSMAVLPDWRGVGAGTGLLERLLAALRPHFRRVSLSVSRSNRASRLYLRSGFRPVNTFGDATVMLRELDAEPVD